MLDSPSNPLEYENVITKYYEKFFRFMGERRDENRVLEWIELEYGEMADNGKQILLKK